MLSRFKSLLLSLSTSFETGMPVQRETIFAISSSVTRSRSKVLSLVSLACSSFSSSCCSCGSLPYCSSAAFVRLYSSLAFSIWWLTSSISERIFCTFSMPCFSFSSFAFIALNWSRSLASSALISSRWASVSLSVSLDSASSSISSCIILCDISSISVGIEYISVLIRAHASSIRSIALSGKNLSWI